MKFKISDYSQTQEVDLYCLSSYPGWHVLDVYERRESSTSTYYNNGGSIPHTEVRYRMTALIGMPSEGENANLNGQIHELQKKLDVVSSELFRQKSDSVKEIDGLKRKIDSQNWDLTDFGNTIKNLEGQIDPIKARNRQIEADLARVEKAIGTIEFQKIVGGPVKQ